VVFKGVFVRASVIVATDFPLFLFFFHRSLLVHLTRACWLIIFCRLKKKRLYLLHFPLPPFNPMLVHIVDTSLRNTFFAFQDTTNLYAFAFKRIITMTWIPIAWILILMKEVGPSGIFVEGRDDLSSDTHEIVNENWSRVLDEQFGKCTKSHKW
jgi:hypothetical protein